MKPFTIGAFLLASAAAPAARPATLCVSPAGGACETSIQAAVNLAGSGDLIQVRPGVYFESVTIPPGKDGLQLVGASRTTTVIDAGPPSVGYGVRVRSSRVLVKNLAVRNGEFDGVTIEGAGSPAEDVIVSGVRVIGMLGSGLVAVDSGALRPLLLANEVRAVAAYGIQLGIGSDGARVKSNTITQAGYGIDASGADLEVSGNRVSGIAFGGIRLRGPRTLVSRNLLDTVGFEALDIVGEDPVVELNRLTNAGAGIVSCQSCTEGRVAGNSNLGSSAVAAFDLAADAAGLVVETNRVGRAAGMGFRIAGDGVVAVRNTVVDSGTFGSGPGYLIEAGILKVLRANSASRVAGDGFLDVSEATTLEGNVSMAAAVDGFAAAGASSALVLVRNRALGSNAAGFAIRPGAAGATLAGNTGARNRYDFCDDGSATAFGSPPNAFAATSTVCDITQ